MASGPGEGDSTMTPDDAFALLGNETRMEILQTLAEARDPLTFSELRDRVGVTDSGQFNYHLDKLDGHYVHKTDDDYQLTRTGEDVVRVVIAGTMTADPHFEPTVIDARCPVCDAPIEITYGDNQLEGICTNCDGVFETDDGSQIVFRFPLLPAGVEDRTSEELFRATIAFYLHKIASFLGGVCPTCSGGVTNTIEVCPDHDMESGVICEDCGQPHMAQVTSKCELCHDGIPGPVRMAVLTHPTVTSFYHDHGIDHRFASWEAFRRSHEVRETLVSTEPLELRLAIPAGNEDLHLTVDDDLDVIDVTTMGK